jgi:hypothetical protein
MSNGRPRTLRAFGATKCSFRELSTAVETDRGRPLTMSELESLESVSSFSEGPVGKVADQSWSSSQRGMRMSFAGEGELPRQNLAAAAQGTQRCLPDAGARHVVRTPDRCALGRRTRARRCHRARPCPSPTPLSLTPEKTPVPSANSEPGSPRLNLVHCGEHRCKARGTCDATDPTVRSRCGLWSSIRQ